MNFGFLHDAQNRIRDTGQLSLLPFLQLPKYITSHKTVSDTSSEIIFPSHDSDAKIGLSIDLQIISVDNPLHLSQ